MLNNRKSFLPCANKHKVIINPTLLKRDSDSGNGLQTSPGMNFTFAVS